MDQRQDSLVKAVPPLIWLRPDHFHTDSEQTFRKVRNAPRATPAPTAGVRQERKLVWLQILALRARDRRCHKRRGSALGRPTVHDRLRTQDLPS